MVNSNYSISSNRDIFLLEDRMKDSGVRKEYGCSFRGNRTPWTRKANCRRKSYTTAWSTNAGANSMDRARVGNKSKPIQLGKEEEIDYMRAVEIAIYCDNLPPLIKDYKKEKYVKR